MLFSLKKAIKTPIKGVARKLRFLGSFRLAVSAWQFPPGSFRLAVSAWQFPPGSLQGKKSPFQAIFGGFMREARQTARARLGKISG
jgi:hypothetical protein